MIYSILYIFLIINILIQLGYWAILFSKFGRQVWSASSAKARFPPISMVVCAKNEAQNLAKNLVYILQQNYNIFEVIVVNDGSDDETLAVLEKFSADFAYLKIITIDKNAPKILQGKKNALTAGIAAAVYDWVLLTDADCRPRTAYWAADMMRTAISENKEMVLGYSRLNAETKITSPFLIAWIRLETIYTALQYVSFANWGLPYMGVGRNMLYHKSLFLANNGLVAHADLLSGDDDLFVRDVATATNTTVCLSANSIVDSAAKETWGDYIQQKTRHLSTSVRYKPLIQLLLGVLSASHLLVYFFGAIWVAIFSLGVYHAYIDNFHFYTDGNFKLFFNHFLIRNDAFQNIEPYIIGLLLLRWLLQIGQLIRVTNILQEKNLRKYVFVFDFMLFLYLFVMSFSFLKRDKKW